MLSQFNPLSYGPTTTGTTPAVNDNSVALATTAYVDRLLLPTYAWFKDDFFMQSGSTSVTTATTLTADTGWAVLQVSGGTQTVGPGNGSFANPGIVNLTTSATSGQGIVLYKGGASMPFGNLAAQGGWEANFVFKVSATTLESIRVGLVAAGQHAADAPTDGIYVEYDTANVGNTDTKFTWVTRASSTPTYSTTNAINADTSYHHFRIRSLVAGTILFSVDGGTETSVATTVPTTIMGPFMQIVSRTTAAKIATIDFYSMIMATTRT